MNQPFDNAVVLLTGGTGFIGSHCLARLVREGCVIHAVNRRGAGPFSDRVTWHAADLRNPVEAYDVVQHVRPSHLMHSAWIAVPGLFWRSPENVNWLEGGLALLHAFGEIGGRRFVGVGTCAEYDWRQTEFREENTPVNPTTLYGKSKAALGAAAFAYADRYRFSAAWGRVFQPYGIGDASERLIPSVIAALLAGRPVALSHCRQERDFIFAPDLADLLVALLGGSRDGVFNVGTGKARTLRTVVESIAQKLGGSELLRFGEVSSPPNEPIRLIADMTKVADQVGWSAPTAFEAGLDEVVERALGIAAGHFNKPDEVKRGIC